MAAYAALVSVMQIIDQIQFHHLPPISLHKKQVQSLSSKLNFLQEFLQGYNPHLNYTAEADPLESRIAEAAYATEDAIESYIVDQILAPSTNCGRDVGCIDLYQCLQAALSYIADKILGRFPDHGKKICSIEFYHNLQKVMAEIDLIMIEVMEIKEKMGVQDQLQIIKYGSFRSTSSAGHHVTMVGFDDVMYRMLEKITRGRENLQIIPIVGMGGIGKTTLARTIYAHPLVKEHFVVRAWSTISQKYNTRRILSQLLGLGKESRGDLREDGLGERLYKYLISRRYLIVMDDLWSIEAWDKVRRFFPDSENGSRIVITTRLSNLDPQFNYQYGLDMKFFDESTSWTLFSNTVFGDEICPLELEEIGRKIVEGCKGLPLSIVVIGGLLSKSELTLEKWELVEENLHSIVNSEDNGSCLQILYTSYTNLPVYLKPCFLYMGVYSEDEEIRVSLLIKLWVAEGFIESFDGKSLEDAAEDWIEELVDRNMVLVEELNHYGRLKLCKIHDLFRDVCLREAGKDKFLCVLGEKNIPQGISHQRRIQSRLSEYPASLLESLESASLVRSFAGKAPKTLPSSFRLLRVCLIDAYEVEGQNSCSPNFEGEVSEYYEEIFARLVNLRLLFVDLFSHPLPKIPSAVSFLWNLQTLFIGGVCDGYVVFELWKMPQLRHVMTYDGKLDGAYCLPPLSDGVKEEEVVLENLHTLYVVSNLSLGEEVLSRIPNIRKLKLSYDKRGEESFDYCLHNLHHLHDLQVLRLVASSTTFLLMRQLTLPYFLKKLTLKGTKLPWEDLEAKIGWLPLLQVLKLEEDSFTGSEWETVEGQFSSLKFLLVDACADLEHWITDSTHFPCLERLVLRSLKSLGEIPSGIGDVPTLLSIKLENCSEVVVDSARIIVEEQEELGNEELQLQVI